MSVCVHMHGRQHDYKQTAKRKRIYVIKKTTWNRNEKKKKKHNHNKNEKNSSCGVSSVWSFKRIRQLELLLLPPPPNRVGGNKTTMCCDDDEEEEIVFFITLSQKINERTNGYAAQVKKLSQEVRVRTLEILFVRRYNQIYCLQKNNNILLKTSIHWILNWTKKRRQKLSTYT